MQGQDRACLCGLLGTVLLSTLLAFGGFLDKVPRTQIRASVRGGEITPFSPAPAISRGESVVTKDGKDGGANVYLKFSEHVVGDSVGDTHVINIRNRMGVYDAGFVCKSFSVANLLDASGLGLKDVHITELEPLISAAATDFVHHMDIFGCVGGSGIVGASESPVSRRWCTHDEFLHRKCKQLLWAYDKGASKFTMPKQYGMLLGPSSGFDHVLLQIHYLLPDGYQPGKDAPLHDSSGFRLWVTPTLRPLSAGTLAVLDSTMSIPAKVTDYVVRVHASNIEIARHISPSLQLRKNLTIVAAHLHAHDHAKSVALEHFRGGQLVDTYISMPNFTGYGPNQTFLPVSPTAPLFRLGDSLAIKCTFDNRAQSDISYGVSHGDEMCGFLVLYAPHAGYRGRNFIETHAWMPSNDLSQARIKSALRSP